eukprot:4236412-Amphidinium_carterae.1
MKVFKAAFVLASTKHWVLQVQACATPVGTNKSVPQARFNLVGLVNHALLADTDTQRTWLGSPLPEDGEAMLAVAEALNAEGKLFTDQVVHMIDHVPHAECVEDEEAFQLEQQYACIDEATAKGRPYGCPFPCVKSIR